MNCVPLILHHLPPQNFSPTLRNEIENNLYCQIWIIKNVKKDGLNYLKYLNYKCIAKKVHLIMIKCN